MNDVAERRNYLMIKVKKKITNEKCCTKMIKPLCNVKDKNDDNNIKNNKEMRGRVESHDHVGDCIDGLELR